jgi:hypothetical protein
VEVPNVLLLLSVLCAKAYHGNGISMASKTNLVKKEIRASKSAAVAGVYRNGERRQLKCVAQRRRRMAAAKSWR